MHSLVIYASRKGNTREIAHAIGTTLSGYGPTDIREISDAAEVLTDDVELIVVGGPTEGHGISQPMQEYLARLSPGAFRGRLAATFDTRLKWPRLLAGSAAEGIAARLQELGARLVANPESFLVTMEPTLAPGELERARGWAGSVARDARRLVPASTSA